MSHSFGFIIIIFSLFFFFFCTYLHSFTAILSVFCLQESALLFGALLCLPAQFDFRSEIIGIEIGFVWAAAAAAVAAAYFALCTLFCCSSTQTLFFSFVNSLGI